MTRWSVDQIASLAPDASSLSAGRGLAAASKWPTLGRAEGVVWGECKGSGKKPYQCRIDLSEPAFKCSCPSRKFPCKHALGLFLLYAESPSALKEGEPPDWVADWLAMRQERAEKKAARAEAMKDAAPDPGAKARREAQRGRRVTDGLAQLERWLADLVSEGLATAPGKPLSFWHDMSAAMVDAQCPGLARMVMEAEASASSGAGWQQRLLDRLGLMWLLVRAGRSREHLPDALGEEVRTQLGFTMTKEEVLARGERLADIWAVVGQVTESDGRLTTRRTWLWGERSDRPALVLDFAVQGAVQGRPFETAVMLGTRFPGECVFYPSSSPLRALIDGREDAEPVMPEAEVGDAAIEDALARAGALIASNPWRRTVPVLLRGVRPARTGEGEGGGWALVDGSGAMLPIATWFAGEAGGIWRLLSAGGGRPACVFGEWDFESLRPLGAWTPGGAYCDLLPRQALHPAALHGLGAA